MIHAAPLPIIAAMKRLSIVLLLGVALVSACSVGRGALNFTPDKLPDAHAGQAYEAIITVTGNRTPVGDLYVSGGSLPDGMTLDFTRGSSNAGTLQGTPTTAGRYVFTVSAWCLGTNVSGQAGDQNYVLVVS
jgi:hypothetical protein